METRKRYYIERTDDGRYAVRRESSNRASGIFDTQREAIERARELNPHDRPDVERVRDTALEERLSINTSPRTARALSAQKVGRPTMRFYSFQIVIEKEPEDEGYYAYTGCGKTRRRRERSAGILPASVELKGVAGWKPALRQLPKEFFRSRYSPTLPGCFSNGKSIEEARRNIREAIEQHMVTLTAHTQPIPQDDRLVHVEELTVGVPE